jgi:hypothetical protein
MAWISRLRACSRQKLSATTPSSASRPGGHRGGGRQEPAGGEQRIRAARQQRQRGRRHEQRPAQGGLGAPGPADGERDAEREQQQRGPRHGRDEAAGGVIGPRGPVEHHARLHLADGQRLHVERAAGIRPHKHDPAPHLPRELFRKRRQRRQRAGHGRKFQIRRGREHLLQARFPGRDEGRGGQHRHAQRAEFLQPAVPAEQAARLRRRRVERGRDQRARQRISPRDAVVVRPELHQPGARGREIVGVLADKIRVPDNGRALRRARQHELRHGGGHVGQHLVVHRVGFLEKGEVPHDALRPRLVQREEKLGEDAPRIRPAHALRAHRRHRLLVHQHQRGVGPAAAARAAGGGWRDRRKPGPARGRPGKSESPAAGARRARASASGRREKCGRRWTNGGMKPANPPRGKHPPGGFLTRRHRAAGLRRYEPARIHGRGGLARAVARPDGRDPAGGRAKTGDGGPAPAGARGTARGVVPVSRARPARGAARARPRDRGFWTVIARSGATKQSSWIATARFAGLAMTKSRAQSFRSRSFQYFVPCSVACSARPFFVSW